MRLLCAVWPEGGSSSTWVNLRGSEWRLSVAPMSMGLHGPSCWTHMHLCFYDGTPLNSISWTTHDTFRTVKSLQDSLCVCVGCVGCVCVCMFIPVCSLCALWVSKPHRRGSFQDTDPEMSPHHCEGPNWDIEVSCAVPELNSSTSDLPRLATNLCSGWPGTGPETHGQTGVWEMPVWVTPAWHSTPLCYCAPRHSALAYISVSFGSHRHTHTHTHTHICKLLLSRSPVHIHLMCASWSAAGCRKDAGRAATAAGTSKTPTAAAAPPPSPTTTLQGTLPRATPPPCPCPTPTPPLCHPHSSLWGQDQRRPMTADGGMGL